MAQSYGVTKKTYEDIQFLGDHPVITKSGVLSGGNHVSGTVVGKVTASGKFVQLAPGASDGSEAAARILLGDLDASEADENGVFVVHGEAVETELTWPDGITEGEKATAIGQLADAGIYVK